jgi:hypothetical protein
VRLYGVALAVFLDLEILVTAVGRVGEAFADDGVAYPEYKLLVFAVCDFGLVHPEAVDRYPAGVSLDVPCAVGFLRAHVNRPAVDEHHAVGGRLGP